MYGTQWARELASSMRKGKSMQLGDRTRVEVFVGSYREPTPHVAESDFLEEAG